MRQYDQANVGYPREVPIEKLMEGSLREYILETEEKIFLGVVGGINVSRKLSLIQLSTIEFSLILIFIIYLCLGKRQGVVATGHTKLFL